MKLHFPDDVTVKHLIIPANPLFSRLFFVVLCIAAALRKSLFVRVSLLPLPHTPRPPGPPPHFHSSAAASRWWAGPRICQISLPPPLSCSLLPSCSSLPPFPVRQGPSSRIRLATGSMPSRRADKRSLSLRAAPVYLPPSVGGKKEGGGRKDAQVGAIEKLYTTHISCGPRGEV